MQKMTGRIELTHNGRTIVFRDGQTAERKLKKMLEMVREMKYRTERPADFDSEVGEVINIEPGEELALPELTEQQRELFEESIMLERDETGRIELFYGDSSLLFDTIDAAERTVERMSDTLVEVERRQRCRK